MPKHVKLFESFLNEAKAAEVVTVKAVKLNKDIQEQVVAAGALAKELKKMSDEYKKKMEPMQELLNKYDENILNTLTGMNVSQAKVEEIIARVMMSKGRLTDSYKDLWIAALEKVNAATKASLLEIQAQNKKQNPDKYWMEYADTNEGLKDIKDWGSKIIDKLKTWSKDVWSKVKAAVSSHENAVTDFENTANKILKANK